SHTIKGGTGSGEVNERHSVTILEGLESRGFEITTRSWIDDFEKEYAEAEKAAAEAQRKALRSLKVSNIIDMILSTNVEAFGRNITDEDISASGTDCCIYVLSRQAGEGGDRRLEKGAYYITDIERDAIAKCAANYSKFVLVINSGASIDMSFIDEIDNIGAVLFICQLGTEGGSAFADIITGKVTPSGKLTDTWAKKYEDIPFANEFGKLNGNLDDEYYKEGIYVGYRYFDTFGVAPRYPFGFGLSYTTFAAKALDASVNGTKISVSAEVQNTGAEFSGKETLQLYVSCPAGKLDREYQSLAAFAKTPLLAPGEKCTLALSFDMADLAAYDESTSSYILEKGDYILRLGSSSADTAIIAAAALADDVVISRHTAICPVLKKFEELRSEKREAEVLPENIFRLAVDASAFTTVVYDYTEPAVCSEKRVKEFVDTLSLKEMVDIVVGIGMFGGKTEFNMPGSVGNTTSQFWDRGLANVTLCDGPAGLRIQKRSTVSKNGKVKAVELALSALELFPKFIKSFMVGNPEKETVIYQYCTAFPVSAALAQTWNHALLEEVGKAVYEEMREYGCVYWLAPAVNIHRNPLCGRNFEYFSEDPFLTGTLAAAITKGIQSEDGYYVTVKHFACNNQEDNRNAVSSNLSERALREIYLRGFERCVREGGAKSIMTSYNRINGVYAPNSHDICTKVLRCEWGFDGVVMTDWFSTSKGKASSALAMKAGNDLIMPGGGAFKKDILSGVKSGQISEEDVRRCCSNVVKSIFNSPIQREYIDKV
ncbi:MAG: glycoside hydrolase family 3 C-terminal domain-containing protein, partial [Oscillospiraceae bacterium]|nr:glycoside hydrolase family 3 C-terminal domain-containing protein [Oscillospiraceae bacterium]